MRLEGKVAVIAGGAGGIGTEICRRFLEEGASVVCADVSESRGAGVVGSLKDTGGDRIVFELLDGASSQSWEDLVERVMSRFGRLDILVTSIYSGPAGSVEKMSAPDWLASFSATSSGVFYGMRAVVPVMKAGGAIVNIASVMAHGGAPENIGYSSAKSSVIAMSRSAAAKLASRDIRVNIVTPGMIQTWALDTSLTALGGPERTLEQVRDAYVRRIPMKRVGEPVEIANAVLFLASPEASYVTGAEIIVDGGMLTL